MLTVSGAPRAWLSVGVTVEQVALVWSAATGTAHTVAEVEKRAKRFGVPVLERHGARVFADYLTAEHVMFAEDQQALSDRISGRASAEPAA